MRSSVGGGKSSSPLGSWAGAWVGGGGGGRGKKLHKFFGRCELLCGISHFSLPIFLNFFPKKFLGQILVKFERLSADSRLCSCCCAAARRSRRPRSSSQLLDCGTNNALNAANKSLRYSFFSWSWNCDQLLDQVPTYMTPQPVHASGICSAQSCYSKL